MFVVGENEPYFPSSMRGKKKSFQVAQAMYVCVVVGYLTCESAEREKEELSHPRT